MTERDDEHRFSEGEGFGDPYEEFDLDPPELSVDPSKVDPVDSRVVPDLLDQHHVTNDMVDVEDLIEVGLSYMGINRFEQAAEAFERAARFAEDALSSLENAIRLGFHSAEVFEEKARALEELGEHEEAEEAAERAEELRKERERQMVQE